MAKTVNNPKEKMRMNIGLADNGIIIRNPECNNEVTLALEHENDRIDIGFDYEDVYKAIGKKIYDWLIGVVIQEHGDELIITNFNIEIVATCKGIRA